MNEDLQQSDAANSENTSEAEDKTLATGATDTPEVVETDEQKNQRVQDEQAEANRKKEEKRQTSIQRRMDELTADKYAERKRADDLAKQNERILALLEGKQTPSATQSDGEPKREQFESYEDFVTARAEFRAEAKATSAAQAAIEKFTKAQTESQTKTARETEQATLERQFKERRAEAEKRIPDYREVVKDWEPNLPNSVVDLILRLPEGADISYHMAKNPALETQFRTSPEHMHGILLGQLLATLKSPAKDTDAPAPGKPVGGKVVNSDGGEYQGHPDGYFAWAQKRDRKR